MHNAQAIERRRHREASLADELPAMHQSEFVHGNDLGNVPLPVGELPEVVKDGNDDPMDRGHHIGQSIVYYGIVGKKQTECVFVMLCGTNIIVEFPSRLPRVEEKRRLHRKWMVSALDDFGFGV